MTEWLILAAFLGGLAVALALEARLQKRSRFGRKRPRLLAGLAILCLLSAAVLGWMAVRLPASPTGQIIHSSAPDLVEEEILSMIPLPEPLVHILPTPTSAAKTTTVAIPSSHHPVRLQIPALKVDELIEPVPVRHGRWDVSELGGQVGLLATTGQTPDDELAMVFAGHMTFPNADLLETGAFADLQYATYGTEIMVQTESETLVYEVAEISRIAPDAVDRLYVPDNNSILLITCTDWAEQDGIYANRLLVRAEVMPAAVSKASGY